MNRETIRKNLNEISDLGLLTKLSQSTWQDIDKRTIRLEESAIVVKEGKYESKVSYCGIAHILNKISGRLVFIDSNNICIIALSLKHIECPKDPQLW